MSWLHTSKFLNGFFWVVVVPDSPSGCFHDGSVGGIGVCYLSLQMILYRLRALGSFTSSPFSYSLHFISSPGHLFSLLYPRVPGGAWRERRRWKGGFFIILSSVSFKSSVTQQLLLFFLSFDHQHEEWWMLIMSTFHLFFFFFLHTHSWKQKVD